MILNYWHETTYCRTLVNGNIIKRWIWFNGDAQPAEERDAGNGVTRRFYSGLGEQIGVTNYFYTVDHLGSVRELTDASAAVRARYAYDPYGRRAKVSGDLEASFGYTGYYQHAPSGLSLALYRAFDPRLGRFMSRDPIEEQGGVNLYGYVGNSPVNWVDPLGLDTCTADRKIGGGPAANRPSSILPTFTHTFTFTKNRDGSIKHTYSWGNTANTHGWSMDQPEDIAAANEAVANGYLQWEGGSDLDPFVDQAFKELNVPENEHRNLGFWRNCKTETGKLLGRAKAAKAAAGK